MIVKRLLGITLSVIGATAIALRVASSQSNELSIVRAVPHFPEVAGRDVNSKPYALPDGFEGRYNLVLMAFERRHQTAVNTWLGPLGELARQEADLRVYEVPTLREFSPAKQQQIDNWMSAGIADPKAREATITVYTDINEIGEALQISSTSRIQLFLVDRNGKVYWRGDGAYSEEQFRDLRSVVGNLSQDASPQI